MSSRDVSGGPSFYHPQQQQVIILMMADGDSGEATLNSTAPFPPVGTLTSSADILLGNLQTTTMTAVFRHIPEQYRQMPKGNEPGVQQH